MKEIGELNYKTNKVKLNLSLWELLSYEWQDMHCTIYIEGNSQNLIFDGQSQS